MNYLVSVLVENDNTERLRAFAEESDARRYVERLAGRLAGLCVAGKTSLFVAYASVYEVRPSGRVCVVTEIDGCDPRDDDGGLGEWR